MNLAIEKSIEPTERGPVCSVCCKPHDKDNPVGYFYPPANALDSWEQAASCDDPDAAPLYAAPVRTKDLTDDDKAEIECALNMAFDLLCKPVDSIAEMYCFGMGDCDEVRQQLKNARAVIAADREANK